jgi:hypothetical protein
MGKIRKHTKFWLESLKGRPRHKQEDNIKMDLMETGLKCLKWIHLVHNRDQWRGS